MRQPDHICFIGSTLPISFIVENHLVLNIKKIYVANQKLEKSAKFIHNKIDNALEIKSLPKNKIFQFLNLFIIFLKIKIQGKKVILFHEISWIIFDIAFHLLKPKYKFFPQVTLNSYLSFEEINKKEIQKIQKDFLILNKLFNFLFKVNIFPKFKLLFIQSDDSNFNNINYIGSFSCQDYRVSNIQTKKKIIKKIEKKTEKKIVILCGIDVGSKNEQKIILNRVVRIIEKKDIKIDVKGHPNWDNIYPDKDFKNIKYLDKYLPFELLDDNQYIGIIGFGSTILSRYPNKSISLLYLIKSIPKTLVEKKIIHLKSLHKENECFYPESDNELSHQIDNLLQKFYE